MTCYEVQYVLPVDNPEKNVRKRCGKFKNTYEVPINYPNAHNLSLLDLQAAVEFSGLFTVSTTSNSEFLEPSTKRVINIGNNSTKTAAKKP
jgi:hypothetical protein